MKTEDFSDIELSYWYAVPSLKRRDFLKTLGGGIIIFLTFGDSSILLSQRQRRGLPTDFNAFLRIAEDGKITCFTGKIEMGQGAMTSLAQTAAEELDVSLESVEMIMGDTDLCPWDMGTFGSMTTRFFGPAFKAAAAEAKAVLMELASEQLNVAKNNLAAENGVIFERGRRNNRVTYGQLAQGKTIARELSEKAVEKAISEFKVIGKHTPRIDAREKVTGQAKYAGDIRYPGMLYAKILRPPAHRASLKSVDVSAAEKMEGVTVVNEDGLVAVLHQDPEEAEKALAAVKADFEIPDESIDDKTIFEHLLNSASNGNENDKRGAIEAGEKQAAESFDETYYNSYVAHATIETHTATVNIEGGKAEAWISTQTPFGDKEQIARALDFPSENVRVRTPFVGGGFGGKTGGSQSVEAARLAKITGKPVQVFWTRKEEFFYDTYRPAAVVKIKSGIDDKGKICLWDYKVYFAGARGSDQFYDVPNNLITVYGEWRRGGSGTHPFGTGAWRAPGANTNIFAKESQIDIMAAKAGIDPVEFRLNNMSDKRMRGVLTAAAEKFGWKPAKAPSMRGFGVACGIDAGTYVASIAEVNVDEQTGKINVERIVCAQDMGLVINPQGAILQMEGCITMGLGYTLSEEVRFKGGNIFDENFDTYKLPLFSMVPKIETVLIDSQEKNPQGGGEPAIVNVGSLIANAVFDATGARLFQLPMTQERVKAAIESK